VLSLSDVTVAIGGRTLLTDVSLRFPAGERIALVGGNGVGKTTLLHVVIGQRDPESGTVSRPKDLRLGWLPQDVVDAPGSGETVLAHVLSGAEQVTSLEDRMRQLEQALEAAEGDEQERLLADYSRVQHRFESLGGYELESEAHRVLAGLGFAAADAGRGLAELSGGWRVRAALARLLIARPDLLVLDEPTNHLDLDTIAWLEQTLRQLPGGLLFVSHDRDFIDAVADRIVEVAAGTATVYDVRAGTVAAEEGGFASFVAQREERLASLRAARAQQDREIAEVERFVERFRYKATKARQVQSRIRQLDRIERIEVPDDRALVARFQLPDPPRAGRIVAELESVSVSYGERRVLTGVDLAIERGRTVALIGPNGAGKTTLLRLLAGTLEPDTGRVSLGHNVEVAVVDQHQTEVMDLDRTVLEEFRTALDDRHRGRNHRSMVAAFGFPGDLADRRVGDLSGGERTRLGLAKAMVSPVNLLLLDEPTNHLDLASRDVLEDALRAYPGTVVLITHDRHVIRAAADALVTVGDGRAAWFDGTYEDWRALRGSPAPEVPVAPAPAGAAPGAASGARRSEQHRANRSLRQKVARLEDAVGKVEDELATLTRELADPQLYADADRVAEVVARHDDAKDRAARLYADWERAELELERAQAGDD
jgi:ATP-binding cassette, subfamily F, member 3